MIPGFPHDPLYPPDVCESIIFPFFGQHPEPFFQNIRRMGVHFFSGSAAEEVFQRTVIGIVFTFVVLAGGHSVAEHFLQIPQRHFHRLVLFGLGIHVVPVFKMVPVSALVVEPGGGIAEQLSFPFVGASGALIIPHTGEKFRGGEFGQVVGQSPQRNPASYGILPHQLFVVRNGLEMADGMEHFRFYLTG